MKQEAYRKYRWFFTSSNKLVIGGKSAEQNESLLKELKNSKKDYTVLHTSSPGSPFSVILSEKSPTKEDIEQTAIFTASFSRQWKLKKKKSEIHIFNLSQLYKTKEMKTGTLGVKGKIKKVQAELHLVLTKQKNSLRAVPESSIKQKNKILLRIIPGEKDKTQILNQLQLTLPSFSKEEILSALPSGGIKIIK